MRIVFTAVLAALCLFISPVMAAPNLVVESPNFDFGEIFQGEQVPHVFSFSNTGDQTLSIDRVNSSCGCTAALISEKTLAPGGKGEVKVSFDSTRFRGQVTKTVYLYSNDPAQPVMQLFIRGNVKESVTIDPVQVNFGPLVVGRTAQSAVRLRNQGNRLLVLGTPTTTAEELTVSLPERQFAAGSELIVTLKLKPKPGQPRFSGYVLLPIEGGSARELRIPVYASTPE